MIVFGLWMVFMTVYMLWLVVNGYVEDGGSIPGICCDEESKDEWYNTFG